MSQKPKSEEEVIAAILAAMDKVQQELIETMSAQLEDMDFIRLNRVINRRHWWQPWKPKYNFPELEDNFRLKVEAGTSLPKTGRVTKIIAPPEFDPDAPKKKGGHVVKRMPRQLQKIKEGQETPHE